MPSCLKIMNGIATAFNVASDVEMFGKSFVAWMKARDRGDSTLLEKASFVNSLALVGFSMAEIGGLCAGTRSETLQKLKTIELLPRVLNVPLHSALVLKKIATQGGDISTLRIIMRLLERGVVSSLADICRTAASAEAYYEQHFLDMTPEELEKAKRPIYQEVGVGKHTHWEIVGYEPVDLEECRRNLTKCKMHFVAATVVRICSQNRTVEKVVCDLGIPTLQRLAAFFGRFIPIGARHGGRAEAPGGGEGTGTARGHERARGHAQVEDHREGGTVHAAPHDDGKELDLLHYPNIPEPLHHDQVFQQYICPITTMPIRDPVRDPTNNKTLYERSAIVTWLQHNPVSPYTKKPLKVEELQEVPVIKNQINHRLKEYQDALHHFIEEHAAAPEAEQHPPQAGG